MNTQPWYRSRIPLRRLGILHGFEDRDLFLPGPLGGVDSSRRTGPDRGVFQEKGVSSWFGSKELLGSFQSSIPVVLWLFLFAARSTSAVDDDEFVVLWCLGDLSRRFGSGGNGWHGRRFWIPPVRWGSRDLVNDVCQ
jgi:hypothetical protein